MNGNHNENPQSSQMSFTDLVRSDLARFTESYRQRGQKFSPAKVTFESFFFKPGFQAAFLYRLAHALFKNGFIYLAWAVTRFSQFLTGAEIEFNAEIGPGLFIAHPCGIVVGRGTKIGAHTTIFQNVTFGAKDWSSSAINNFPKTGNNCFFFANSVIIGGITIGNNCVAAAGAVLTKDMPSGALAKGIPAQVVPGKGEAMLREWGMMATPEFPEENL